jgi:hypothetical protein
MGMGVKGKGAKEGKESCPFGCQAVQPGWEGPKCLGPLPSFHVCPADHGQSSSLAFTRLLAQGAPLSPMPEEVHR